MKRFLTSGSRDCLIYHSGMKIFAILLLAATLSAQSTPPRAVRSPEISADHRVTFRLMAPNASAVAVSGEFQEGSKSLEKDGQGLWSLTLGPLDPEIYNYNFTIDGVRTIDPNNPNVKTGSTPSTIMSIVEVRGESPAFYDGRAVP